MWNSPFLFSTAVTWRGDQELFSRLHDKLIPKLIMRESQSLVQRLAELTRDRHAKYGGTVFHLEPNVKETPGGLRDYNVACWLALISAMDKLRDWPDPATLLPASVRRQFDPALEFLMSVRCFLHFRHGRDDNMLTWEAQDDAAARKIGVPDADVVSAGRLDAGLFRPRPRHPPHCAATVGGNSRRPLLALPAISELAFTAFQRRNFPSWTA